MDVKRIRKYLRKGKVKGKRPPGKPRSDKRTQGARQIARWSTEENGGEETKDRHWTVAPQKKFTS